MKPRPTSLHVPRTEPLADPAPMARSQSRVSASSQARPPLVRARSTEVRPSHNEEARALFERGAFADAPAKKARLFDVGAPLFTHAHARLVDVLRDECVRLHNYARHLAQKSSDSHARLEMTEQALSSSRESGVTLREQNRRLLSANQALVAELKTATESLAEVDAMFMNVSKLRMGRLSDAATQARPLDLAVQAEAPRPLSPTPNRAFARSDTSLGAQG